MTRETCTYVDGYFNEYDVEYMYSLGSLGNYFEAPEAHEVEVLEVYDTQHLTVVSDQELIDEITDYLYDKLNDN